jgi:asparagine synthetase B (glutamine-hydrolysing)
VAVHHTLTPGCIQMCGLAGFIDTSGEKDNQLLAAVVSEMAKTLRHRGPDDDATWTDAQTGIALGFRRLAILDLTESGRQPMHSRCERYVIVFNGEIYNHGELRQQLEVEGHPFRGRSDTEVILTAVSQWGLSMVCLPSHCGTAVSANCILCGIASGRSRCTTVGWEHPFYSVQS